MSAVAKLSGVDFDAMVERGAFVSLPPMKIELIHGELRFISPAGPFHDDYIDFLGAWSHQQTNREFCTVRVQCGVACGDHRPEPDVCWLKPGRYRKKRATSQDAMLVIEVADASLLTDLNEKALLYAEHGIPEYWVVDVPSQLLHVHRHGDGVRYRSIEVHSNPATISPLCRPTARLDLTAMFIDAD